MKPYTVTISRFTDSRWTGADYEPVELSQAFVGGQAITREFPRAEDDRALHAAWDAYARHDGATILAEYAGDTGETFELCRKGC